MYEMVSSGSPRAFADRGSPAFVASPATTADEWMTPKPSNLGEGSLLGRPRMPEISPIAGIIGVSSTVLEQEVPSRLNSLKRNQFSDERTTAGFAGEIASGSEPLNSNLPEAPKIQFTMPLFSQKLAAELESPPANLMSPMKVGTDRDDIKLLAPAFVEPAPPVSFSFSVSRPAKDLSVEPALEAAAPTFNADWSVRPSKTLGEEKSSPTPVSEKTLVEEKPSFAPPAFSLPISGKLSVESATADSKVPSVEVVSKAAELHLPPESALVSDLSQHLDVESVAKPFGFGVTASVALPSAVASSKNDVETASAPTESGVTQVMMDEDEDVASIDQMGCLALEPNRTAAAAPDGVRPSIFGVVPTSSAMSRCLNGVIFLTLYNCSEL